MHVQLPRAHNIKMVARVGDDLLIIPLDLDLPVEPEHDYVKPTIELLPLENCKSPIWEHFGFPTKMARRTRAKEIRSLVSYATARSHTRVIQLI